MVYIFEQVEKMTQNLSLDQGYGEMKSLVILRGMSEMLIDSTI